MTCLSKRGFSLVEMLVAVAISLVLFGICVAAFIKVTRYKRRSEQVLFLSEKARAIFSKMERDISGLHVISDSAVAAYFKINSNRLYMCCALENSLDRDYCMIAYGVSAGHLRRDEYLVGDPEPSIDLWPIFARDAESISFSSVPVSPVAGELPGKISISLRLKDPGAKSGYQEFNLTLCPGSEEN
jgi:prepilin-type N-terminal cleavage/methylation domain-containing protein